MVFFFRKISQQGIIFSASLETNRKSVQIQASLDKNNHVVLSRISDDQTKEELIKQIGGMEKATEFFKIFSFNLNRPNICEAK